MSELFTAAQSAVQGGLHFFQTVAPGGFGIVLIPLGVLAAVSYLVSRKPTYRG
jgi:hypothetical protein